MTRPNDSNNQERNIGAQVYVENTGEDVVAGDKHDNSVKNRIFKVFNSTKRLGVYLSFFSIVYQQPDTEPQVKKVSGNSKEEIPEISIEQQEAKNADSYKTQGVAITTNRQGRISILLIMFVLLFTFFYYEYLKNNQKQRLQNWSKDALQQFKSDQTKALKLALKAGKKLNNPLLKNPFDKSYLTTAPVFTLQQIIEQSQSNNSIKEFDVSQHPLWAIEFVDRKILTGGWDQKVYLCNISNIKNEECSCDFSIGQKCEFDVGHTVTSTNFMSDSNEFVVATQDGRILITENMKIENSLEDERNNESKESAILSLSYHSEREEIAAGRWNGNITLHDSKLNETNVLTDNSSNLPIRKVSYHPSGEQIVIASENGKIYLIDLTKSSPDFDPVDIDNDRGENNDKRILSLDFSLDGRILAIAGEDGFVRLLEVSEIRNNEDKPLVKWNAEQDWVTSVIFADERNVIATAGWNGTVKLWDYSGNQLGEWNLKRPVTSLSFNATGDEIVAAKLDGTVSHWKIETLPELIERGNKIIEKFDNEK